MTTAVFSPSVGTCLLYSIHRKQRGTSLLSEDEVQMAAALETTLRQPSKVEYDRLVRHGYKVAEATLFAYDDNQFNA